MYSFITANHKQPFLQTSRGNRVQRWQRGSHRMENSCLRGQTTVCRLLCFVDAVLPCQGLGGILTVSWDSLFCASVGTCGGHEHLRFI